MILSFLVYNNVVPPWTVAAVTRIFVFLEWIESADDVAASVPVCICALRTKTPDGCLVSWCVVPQAQGLFDSSTENLCQIRVRYFSDVCAQLALVYSSDLFQHNHRRFAQSELLTKKDV